MTEADLSPVAGDAAAELVLIRRNYFPTPIFQIDVPDPGLLNETLLAAIRAERARDAEGIERSNMPELGGWHSHNRLHKEAAFAPMTALIGLAMERISAEQGFHEDYRFKIGTMWSIINPPGSANRAHIHPSCLLSGVYYIQAPAGAGSIEFTDPRTAHLMNAPKFSPSRRKHRDTWTKVQFDPVPGRMIIFPSWLYHAVDTNLSREEGERAERVIISFNLNQVKR